VAGRIESSRWPAEVLASFARLEFSLVHAMGRRGTVVHLLEDGRVVERLRRTFQQVGGASKGPRGQLKGEESCGDIKVCRNFECS